MIGRSVESISSRVPHLDRTTRPVERPPSESRVDQFKQALSAHVKALSQHQEALLGSLKNPNKETLKASLRAIYDLSKLPGGKAYVRGTVGEYVANHKMPKKLTPEQKPFVAVFAALSGNEYMFSKAGLTPEEMRLIKVGRKNLLHLACQGGKKEIIKTVSFAFEKKSARDPFESEYPSESFFLKKPWFEKAPMHYLTLELAKELHLEKAYLQYHSVISPKVDSAVVSAITFLPRAFQGAIAVASSSYQRKARLGESAAEGEQLIAKPSPFRANYAAKKALYDAFETLEAGQTEVPHLFDFALFKYVRANTFHYLGAAIEKGNYEIAAKMIANGYYNEISPRMLTILSLSPLNREQQFGLCREFLKRAYQTKNLDEQVLIMRHLISIPDGKKEAEKMLESLEPVDKEAQEEPHRIALAALLGDKTQFDAYFNQNAAACYLKTKTGQTIFHLACQGGNAEIIKILADGRPDPTNNPNPFLVEDVRPSVLGKLVETANRPIDFMTLETANELDRLYLHDPNAPGSFSMAVLHTFYVRTPIQLTAILGGALAGKLSGTVTVSALLPVLERITTAPIGTGAIHTMTEVSAAITESAALNIPVYGGAISGAVGTNWFGRRIVNSWRAEKLGLEDSLSQFEGKRTKTEPVEIKIKSVFGNQEQTDFEEHLANRRPDAALQFCKDHKSGFQPQITETLVERLARIPEIEIKTRAEILAKLIIDAKEPENSRPQDGHKAIETLLESQLELGHGKINKAVAEAILKYLEQPDPLSVGKLRSCLIIAVRLKNQDLIARIQSKSPDLESLWLDTFVRREKSSVFGNVTQLDRGNTLMHVAAATGDARFIQWMAEQWAKHYQTRRQKDPGKEAKRRSVKGNLLERRPWQTDNESNRMNAELTSNPFSTPNALGQTPAQLLPASVARELDELYRIDSQKPGSFMEVARENLEAASIILGAEVAYALPAKLGLNIGLAHAVLAFVALGTSIGASKGGPVGAILGAVLAEFFMGTAIAGVGLAMGAVTGKKSIKIIRKMQNAARGYTREVTQLNPMILRQAKADLLAFCKMIISSDQHSVVDEIFSQEIKKPDDLAGLLVKLHGRIPELGEVVAEKAFAVVDLRGVEEAEEVPRGPVIPGLTRDPAQDRVREWLDDQIKSHRSDTPAVSRGQGLPNLDSSLRAERSNDEQTSGSLEKPNVQRVSATHDQPVIPALSRDPVEIGVKGPDKQRTNLRRSDTPGVSRRPPPVSQKTTHRGLKNFSGAACFANASLQVLARIPELRQALKKTPKEAGKAATLENDFSELAENLVKPSGDSNALTAEGVLPLGKKGGPFEEFGASSQEDGAEFIMAMFGQLNAEARKVVQGEMVVRQKTKTETKTQKQAFTVLPIAVSIGTGATSASLQDGLKRAFEEEIVDILTGQTHHETKVSKLPPYLIIHLKRFDKYNRKITGAVEIPEELDMRPYMVSPDQANGGDYELVSVMNHIGTTPGSGHYTATIRDPADKKWRNYNDTSVTERTDSQVRDKIKTSAYVLVYRRKDVKTEPAIQPPPRPTTRKASEVRRSSAAEDRPVVVPKMRALSFYDDPKKVPGTKKGEHRSLQEIWSYRDDWGWMEGTHDYIQWLFPLSEGSPNNTYAPTLTAPEITAFKQNRAAQANLRKSFNMMLGFYGLQQTQASEVKINAKTFEERAQVWLTDRNHNYLRITRMLTSMRLLGLEKEAAAFFKCLTGIYNDKNKNYREMIGAKTWSYWQDAATKEILQTTPRVEASVVPQLDSNRLSAQTSSLRAKRSNPWIATSAPPPRNNEPWFKSGDMSAFTTFDSKYPIKALQSQLVRENKKLRNVFGSGNCWITASNYVFLTEFINMMPAERQRTITNFQSRWSTPSAVAYAKMLEEIDSHLQENTLSDDFIMGRITSPEYMPVITDFVRSLPGLSKDARERDGYGDESDIQVFAGAVGFPAFPILIAGTDTKGKPLLRRNEPHSGVSKQLIFFFPPEGHQGGHYMVVEPNK